MERHSTRILEDHEQLLELLADSDLHAFAGVFYEYIRFRSDHPQYDDTDSLKDSFKKTTMGLMVSALGVERAIAELEAKQYRVDKRKDLPVNSI